MDCNGNANGEVTVAADAGSGTAPYLYSIDGGATQASETFSGLAEGSYTVTLLMIMAVVPMDAGYHYRT